MTLSLRFAIQREISPLPDWTCSTALHESSSFFVTFSDFWFDRQVKIVTKSGFDQFVIFVVKFVDCVTVVNLCFDAHCSTFSLISDETSEKPKCCGFVSF